MRDRHIPRLCTVCAAPLASQEDACWQCGARWQAVPERRDVIARVARETRSDTNRWTDEGGSLAPERPAPREPAGAL